MRAGRGGIRCDQGGSSCEPGVVCDTSRPGCYLMRTVWGGSQCEPPGEVSDASRLGWYLMPAVRVARSRQEPPWKRARTRQEPPGAARSHLEPPEAGHTTPQEPKKGGRKNRAPLGRELLEKGCRFLGTRSGALCEEKGAPRGWVLGRAAAFWGDPLGASPGSRGSVSWTGIRTPFLAQFQPPRTHRRGFHPAHPPALPRSFEGGIGCDPSGVVSVAKALLFREPVRKQKC